MKKVRFVWSFLLVFLLCGCSVIQQDHIEVLKSWYFQFNEGTNEYRIFFGLLNQDGESISADVDVDIRIVNEADEEVYSGTKSVSEDDFGYYTNQVAGEQYLASIRIPASDIALGTSASGKVYLTVYKEDVVSFDEVNCDASYCLPIKDVQLTHEALPLELNVKSIFGDTQSTIEIDDVTYNYEKSYTPQLEITISGEKTYGTNSSGYDYDIIGYKLYDSDEYMVDSGMIYLSKLSAGDKFKDSSIKIYDVIPGMTYVLKLTEYDW